MRVGTRESKLAAAQAEIIISAVKDRHPGIEFEIVKFKTKGNVLLDDRADVLAGKGLFVSVLENALLNGTIDIAVHSMKDMPARLPDGLCIAAVSRREDPRDVLVTEDGLKLKDLKEGSVIGTSSIRREFQLLSKRPDLRVKNIRGNIDTRLEKLCSKEYDGLILAAAGLIRLGLSEMCSEYFKTSEFIPAIGQGILCVEAKADADIGYLTDSVHDEDSDLMLRAERTFMMKLNGGCSIPLAAYADIGRKKLKLYGMRISDGAIIKDSIEGDKRDAGLLGETLARILEER